MAKETAEQKLLKLIENTDAQESVSDAQPAPVASAEAQKVLDSVKGVDVTALTLPSFLGNVIAVFKDPALIFKLISSLGLKELNKILLIAIVGVGIFFVSGLSKGIKLSNREVHFSIPENIQDISDNLFPAFKELAEYLEIVGRRNIFQPFELEVKEEEEIPEEVKAVQRVTERAKDLRLVGISWEDTLESAEAMIENTVSGVTYFLKSGEKIQGVKVKHIYADGITIVYENQEMELRL